MERAKLEIHNKKTLGAIFNALSNEERIKALELFGQGKELSEISELTGMSRSGFQKVVEAFRELGLIERAGHRSYYKLSSRGEKILEIIKDFGVKLEPIEEEEAEKELEALTSVVPIEKIEKVLERIKRKKSKKKMVE